MRKFALAGMFVVIFMTMNSSKASAETLGLLQVDNNEIALAEASILATLSSVQAKPEVKRPQVKIYIVAEGDSLITIAGKHDTEWKRLFYKNKNIKNPDIINIGDKIIIPSPKEKLKARPIPKNDLEPEIYRANTRQPAATNTRTQSQIVSTVRGSSAGNLYTPGYCTWYAKNRRPDLPNNLGNADTWVSRASAQGIPTGSTPRAGAIGQQGMHVVYVERVNSNGTVTVSEMNFEGWYVISTRTVPASYFMYIY